MKKILNLFAIFLISTPLIFAQTTPVDPTTASLDEMLEKLQTDEGVREFDLSGFEGKLDATDREDIQKNLEEEGYDAETVTTLMGAVDDINNGNAGTVGNLLDQNPDLEDAMIDVIATQAVNEMFTGEQQEEIEKTLKTVDGLLGLLSGFGQATANGSVASSLFGYQGYKIFAFSLGSTLSLSPDLDTITEAYDITQQDFEDQEMIDELNALGIKAGVAVQSFALNFGINTSFLVDGLYLGGVIGSSSIKITESETTGKVLGITAFSGGGMNGDDEVITDPTHPDYDSTKDPDSADYVAPVEFDASMDASTFGIRANYQLIDPFSIPILFRWNGINVGTGFIYNSFNIKAKTDLSETIGLAPGTLGAKFSIINNSYTIPLEVSTGVRLISAVNVSVGAGVDLQFGTSEIDFSLLKKKDAELTNKILTKILDEILEKGGMSFPYGASYEPEVINPRLQAGVGIGIGPLTLLDIYGVYYPLTGFAMGANITFRW